MSNMNGRNMCLTIILLFFVQCKKPNEVKQDLELKRIDFKFKNLFNDIDWDSTGDYLFFSYENNTKKDLFFEFDDQMDVKSNWKLFQNDYDFELKLIGVNFHDSFPRNLLIVLQPGDIIYFTYFSKFTQTDFKKIKCFHERIKNNNNLIHYNLNFKINGNDTIVKGFSDYKNVDFRYFIENQEVKNMELKVFDNKANRK
jgi:competence protein ComGF